MMISGISQYLEAGDFPCCDTPLIGSLWKTITGGDGTLTSTMFASSILFNHDFTLRSACDTSDLSIIYQNPSCNYSLLKTFTIQGLDSNEFSSVWKHHLGFDGIPDTIFIKIFPFKSGPGTYTFRSHFENDEFETIDTSFDFTIFPSTSFSTLSCYLKDLSLSGISSDTFDIPIFINSSQPPSQLAGGSIDLTYSLNNNLLTPFAFLPISGVTSDPVQTAKETASVTLHFDPVFTFNGETELGRLRCVAFVTDTLETNIILTVAAHSSRCLATLIDSNVTHFTLTGCGAQTLLNFMKLGTEYNIMSIIPNPAENSVQIELKSNGLPLHYELFDVLGVMQKGEMSTGSKLQLNLTGLSSGNYYFQLSGESGIPVIKCINT
jgi:hypothetical protein